MGIPDGELYSDGQLGAGEVATIEPVTVHTEQAGAEVGYGQGVTVKDGLIVPATKGHIFGVAVRRTHINGDHLYPATVENDKWLPGEMLGVLREGTISVPINEDVNMNENAAVDTDGNFKPAGASDTVVGVFLGSGNKGGTARMQTRIQLANDNVDGKGLHDEMVPQVHPSDLENNAQDTKPQNTQPVPTDSSKKGDK